MEEEYGAVLSELEGGLSDLREFLAPYGINVEKSLLRFSCDDTEKYPELDVSRVAVASAYTAACLYYVSLRCNGPVPEDHPVRSDLERIRRHMKSVREEVAREEYQNPSEGAVRIDPKAAGRVIRHHVGERMTK